MDITLPLPPPVVHPNARVHWRIVHKARARQRRDAFIAAIDAVNRAHIDKPYWKRVRIDAVFHKPGIQAKRADRDGLIASCKAYIDGIEDSRVIANDSGVEWGKIDQLIGDKAKERKLVLRITPIEGDDE